MRLWVLTLVASGCFSKPGAPLLGQDARGSDARGPDTAIDAFITVDCSQTLFTGVAQPLNGTAGYADGDPAITADKLEVFFVHDITTAGVYEIWHTTRSSSTGSFATPTKVDLGGAATDSDVDPAPTADGSSFVFLRNGFPFIATKTPAVTSNPTPGTWVAQPLPGPLTSQLMSSIDLAPDGKTLYWNTGSNELHIATLNTITGQFEDKIGTFGSGFNFPTVSADGRELYYWNGTGLVQTTRATTNDAFPSPGNAMMLTCPDPDLSADGQMLVCFVGNGVSALTRTCLAPQ